MTQRNKSNTWIQELSPFLWGGFLFIIAQAITFYAAFLEKPVAEANQIVPGQVALGFPLIYFFGAILLLAIVLIFIPIDKLRIVFRIFFAFLYAWGSYFILFLLGLSVLGLTAGSLTALFIALLLGVSWYLMPKVWLHNVLLILALSSAGAIFGYALSPLTAIYLMALISVYDILSVRFGHMLWMVKKMSESETLPAFVIPRKISVWNLSLKGDVIKRLLDEKSTEREFAILGGGDIGFPLLLIVSVFFAYGFPAALLVGAFSLIGLFATFAIHSFLLKGRPMPALPPIAFAGIIGFIIVYLISL